MWMRERDSHRVCTLCGTCHGYLHVNERPGEYDWMKKKSVHKRNRWMEKWLRERGVHWVARVADAVSALPFITEFQVKPDRTGMGDHLSA